MKLEFLMATMAVSAAAAFADSVWTGGATLSGADWSDETKWSGGAPTANSTVQFPNPVTANVDDDMWGNEVEQFERIKVIVDPSAASFIALLKKSDHFRPIAANNEVINGIRNTSTAMERGIIRVHERCKQWKNEAQGYIWDEKAQEDRPVKDMDHLMDAMRYFVQTNRLVKPIDVEDYKSPFARRQR